MTLSHEESGFVVRCKCAGEALSSQRQIANGNVHRRGGNDKTYDAHRNRTSDVPETVPSDVRMPVAEVK